MSKFSVGDIVIPHEFSTGEGGLYYDAGRMDHFIGKEFPIDEVKEYGGGFIYSILGWAWPESALTPYVHESEDGSDFDAHKLHDLEQQAQLPKRKYDLGEFTKAAMQGLCADPNCTDRDAIPESAIIIARATIKALQEAEKEEML